MRAVVWGTASILPEQCVALHRLLIDEIDLPPPAICGAAYGRSATSSRATATQPQSRPPARSSATAPGRWRPPLLAFDTDATLELRGLLDHAGATPATA